MKSQSFFLLALIAFALSSCIGLKTAAEIGLKFSTEKSKLPDTLNWREIGFAKELINQKDLVVVISGGTNPIPLSDWDKLKVSFPYTKTLTAIYFSRKPLFIAPQIQI